jgi:N-acetylmuramoyl-L-alanine amidase
MSPQYVVMHYTAGPSAQQAINWLSNPSARASAHIVISREGEITQMVPFNIVAWHAGSSSWQGLTSMNRHSIGIELSNAGPLMHTANNWVSWFGQHYGADEVIEAIHKNQTQMRGWHLYTPKQLYAALDLSALLIETYGLKDVIGHDDIAPARKTDPGPAFPMESFRAHLFGRPDSAEDEQTFATTARLHIRSGPGSEHQPLDGSPLPSGTRLHVIGEQGSWRQVEVLDEVDGIMDLEGWVHGRYIQAV